MSQDPLTPKSGLPKLPDTPDRTGRHAEVVDGSHLVYLILGGMGVVIVASIAAFPMHSPAVGAVVLGLGALAAVALAAVGRACIVRLFRRTNRPATPALHASEPEGEGELERHGVACLGQMLGNPNGASMRAFCETLADDEAATFRENRAREADATWQWLLGCPDYEEMRVTSHDGLALVGHALRCNPGSRLWVVLLHGWNGDWTEGMLYARHYAEHGYNVLLCESRSHGASEGTWVTMGWNERLDVAAWARELVRAEGDGTRVVLHGHSMGAATAVMAGSLPELPGQVIAVVADSAYADIWNVLLSILREQGVPAHPVADVASLVFRNTRGGANLLAVRPVDDAKRSRVPVLFLHGDKDVFVPPYMALDFDHYAAGAAAGDGHRLVRFAHANHCQASLSDPELYWGSVFGFLDPLVGDDAPDGEAGANGDAGLPAPGDDAEGTRV